jgi:hypothetical protein
MEQQHKRRKKRSDLLGCICLDGEDCTRNCRLDEEEWIQPNGGPSIELVRIRHRTSKDPPVMDEPANIACTIVEHEESLRPGTEVVGVAAWSNGRMRIWFKKI